MNRLALVAGVSCSGKDYLIKRVKPLLPNGIRIVCFGDELFKELQKTHPGLESSDQIRYLNTPEVIRGVGIINSWLIQTQPAVVSTHLVFNSEGKLVTIPETFDQLVPALFIHVSAPVEEIAACRRAKNRGRRELVETEEQIVLHQDLSIRVSCREARRIGTRLVKIWNRPNLVDKNISVLRQVLSTL